MIAQIKIIDNELVSTLITSKQDFLKENNIIEKQCLFLDKIDEKDISKFLTKIKDENFDKFVCLDYQKNKFDKKELEEFVNLEIDEEETYRIVFINHSDLNKNFDFLMNETLVLMIDKKINFNNL